MSGLPDKATPAYGGRREEQQMRAAQIISPCAGDALLPRLRHRVRSSRGLAHPLPAMLVVVRGRHRDRPKEAGSR